VHNRRNYYRLLQVQPDAAPDVIRASYRAIMQKLRVHPDLGGEQWNAMLVNEAYAVLSDPQRRARYDAARRTAGAAPLFSAGCEVRAGAGPGAGDDRAAPAAWAAASGLQSLTCPLCRTVSSVPADLPEARRCRACDSPLDPVAVARADAPGARAVPRLARELPLLFVRAGPGAHALPGTALDLSSQGMRFVTAAALVPGELLRLECALLGAVARVVTCSEQPRASGRFQVGVVFVTASFRRRQGSLLAREA